MFKKSFYFILFFLFVFHLPSLSRAQTYEFSMDSLAGQVLAPLPENHWLKLNINKFNDVWTPSNQRPRPEGAPSTGSPASIIAAWGSMAWDSNRGDLIFFGGGHANYPGNEVYRWRASTLNWERASLPSNVVQVGTSIAHFEPVDGVMKAPIAAHTYDNSEYFPIVDRFVTFGGADFNNGSHFRFADGTATGPYFWEPSKADGNQVGGTTGSHVRPDLFPHILGGQMWNNRNNVQYGDFVDGATGYAQDDGKDVLYIQSRNDLLKYTVVAADDSTQDTCEKVGYTRIALSGQGAGAFDPDRNLFLRTSGNRFTYWRLDNPGPFNGNFVFTPQALSDSFDFNTLVGYGLDYDPVRKVFVLWNGSPEIWILVPPDDLQTGTWVLYPQGVVSPVAPNRFGWPAILGKWKYVRALDVFIGVFDGENGDIWAYKPKNWQPVPADDHPPYLLNPQDGEFYLEGSDITLEAGVIDADGSVLRIEFYRGDDKIGEAFSAPFRVTWENAPAGIHEITAVSVDHGNLLVSQPVTITVSRSDPSVKTILLRDGLDGYAGTYDSYIYQYFPNSNYGDRNTLLGGSSESQSAVVVRFAIFQSEGGPVPDGAVIDSATLGLYKYTAYDHVYRAYAFLQDWKENEITWNRSAIGVPWAFAGANGSGSDIASVADGEGSVGWSADWLQMDVSSGVARFSAGTAPNYGWKVAAVSGNSNTKRFYSREFSDSILRPSLLVHYREVNTGNLSPEVSISSPYNGQVLPLGDAINLRANATDLDGHIVRVEFYQGDIKLGEAAQAPYELSWPPEQPGTYVLTAIAIDNEQARSTSSLVTISVVGENIAPTVMLSSPIEGEVFTQGETIVLSAEAFDADGHIAKVAFYQGESKLGEALSAPYALDWVAPQPGIYSIRAEAMDDEGASGWSELVTIEIKEAQSGSTLSVVLRDGLNGYEGTRDAHIYSFHSNLNFGDRPGLLSDTHYLVLVRFAIFASEGGPVPDGAQIESATLSLYKRSFYDHAYQAYPLLRDWREDQVTWNQSMAGIPWLQGGASAAGADLGFTPDGEGEVGWSPQWLEVDVSAGVQRMAQDALANYGWKLVPVSGNFNLKSFHAREYQADASLRPTLTITYRWDDSGGNLSPMVAMTAPVDGASFVEGESITLSANATDSDGHIARVEFYQGDVKWGEVYEAPYELSWTPSEPGTYALTAVATDNENARTTSGAVHISVVGENIAPTVMLSSPIAGEVFTQGETIVVSAEAFDADGQISKVAFYQGESMLGEVLNAPYALDWVAPQPGIYSIRAEAMDDEGASGWSELVTIEIKEAQSGGTLSVVLRDGLNGYEGTRDAHIYSFHSNRNFGQSPSLLSSSAYADLVRFAIFASEGGPVPDGAFIESATLSLYKSTAYNHTYQAYPLLRDWREDQVSWNQSMAGVPWLQGGASAAGSDLGYTADGEAAVGWAAQWLDVDVTPGVQRMAQAVSANYGWKLVPVSGNSNLKRFHSREYQDNPALRPTLTIRYR